MTLDFQKPDRGSIEETFYPWVLTTQRYKQEGIPAEIADGAKDITNDIVGKHENDNPEKYLPVSWGEGVMEYEQYLGCLLYTSSLSCLYFKLMCSWFLHLIVNRF